MKKILFINCSTTGNTEHLALRKIKDDFGVEDIKIVDINTKMKNVISRENMSKFYSDVDEWIEMFLNATDVYIASGIINFAMSPTFEWFLSKLIAPNKTVKYTSTGRIALMEDRFNKLNSVNIIISSGSVKERLGGIDDDIVKRLKFIFEYLGLKEEKLKIYFAAGMDVPELYGKPVEEKAHHFKHLFNFK